uniref:Uncharacterized protein n=1 Tax=Amphimedon queenslandica TaxID=400682 RepID=A0A1X7UXP5_AMPQE
MDSKERCNKKGSIVGTCTL